MRFCSEKTCPTGFRAAVTANLEPAATGLELNFGIRLLTRHVHLQRLPWHFQSNKKPFNPSFSVLPMANSFAWRDFNAICLRQLLN